MDGAWIGAFSAIAGIVVAQACNLLVEGRRARSEAVVRRLDREHERQLRNLELNEARLARLYTDRRVAYAAFLRASETYQRAKADFGRCVKRIRELLVNDLDTSKARAELKEIGLRRVTSDLQERLLDLETIASEEVELAALTLRSRVDEAHKLARRLDPGPDPCEPDHVPEPKELEDLLKKHQTATAALRDAEVMLRLAIRAELGLDAVPAKPEDCHVVR